MPNPAGQDAPTITVLHGADQPPGLAERAGDARLRFASDAAGLAEALSGSDVLPTGASPSDAVRGGWTAPDAGSSVRWVHTASAGVDRVAFPELLASGAVLTNSRGVFDRPMAEWVLGVVLAFAKDLPRSLSLQREGTWRHRETEPVAGRRSTVVGSGPIGHAIADLLRAAGLRVELVGRVARDGAHAFEALDDLLPDTDFLVLAAPLTEQTRGVLNARTLALLPRTARVVNVGRGPLIVQDDLVAALRDGTVAGAALDVFEVEPLPADSPLWTDENVIVSPHMSGDVVGWRDTLVDLFVENLDLFRAGHELRNVVDKERGYVSTSGGRS